MRPLARLCGMLLLLTVVGPAKAQMIPLADHRENRAYVSYLGVTDEITEQPPAPFAYFNNLLNVYVPNPDPEGAGSCEASSFQVSQFFPAGISASGTTAGRWAVVPFGTYSALSLARFDFRLNSCIEYQLDVWVEPGDLAGSGEFFLDTAPATVPIHRLVGGELHVTGRLSPGDYTLEGRSSFNTSVESFQGATYSHFWTCTPCQNPLIVGQPNDVLTPCGTPAEFAVTTQASAGSLTFQWRRNGVPLVNNSHTSGVNSPTLTIADPCHPDSGYYDVLVSNGAVTEPSRMARLTIGSTGDAPPPHSASPRFALELAGPSPFTRETSFRYSAARALHARVAIHDVTGARVRTLVDRELSGTGVLTWDGRTREGSRAPAGVYFVRVEAGERQPTLRVVLLD